ncbi:hypothetical protein BG015_002742 [Linnemannia schmuckeri]|uniref:Uncharacterized protein n=1 Tax=Linnemannia schmuckeri TaxID=64567 RepID=A0A9P5RNP0_9FUNG|nr:hypothetical protein BG015_002742 [Linnemannia schmuckeri]
MWRCKSTGHLKISLKSTLELLTLLASLEMTMSKLRSIDKLELKILQSRVFGVNQKGLMEGEDALAYTSAAFFDHNKILINKDIFDILFYQVRKLQHHSEVALSELFGDLLDNTRQCIIKHGCLPRIKSDARLFVVHDEGQVLGDEFNGSFQSNTSVESQRTSAASAYASYLWHRLEYQYPLVDSDLGSGLKDSSTDFEEKIVESNEQAAWKINIGDMGDKLSKPSGPDLIFLIQIDSARLIPVFAQMKLHQGSSNFSEKDCNDALSTVSAPKIEGRAKTFRKYCPNNVYISMIAAYPTNWTDKLPAPSELPDDSSGVQ